ncbi:MAG: HAD-IA family hydrolase [Thermincola sp.]|nr:HAD-IA family hydrolase [Thermincola sp.]MDT3703211.1 HAD-IA family hydrolase [Thermincola sp.]
MSFDVHGTLVEKGGVKAFRAAVKSVVSFLNSRDVHLTEEDYFSIWKNNLKCWSSYLHENKEVDFYRWYEGILYRVGIAYDKSLIDLFNNYWMEGFKNFTKPIQGAGKLLSELKRQGYKLGVVSNGLARNNVLDLQRTGLESYFSSIVISSDVGYRKPESAPFLKALAELETNPQNAVMVGDSMKEDICGAKKVGMRTVWVRGCDGLRTVTDKVLDSDAAVQPDETDVADVVVDQLEELYLLLSAGRWPS